MQVDHLKAWLAEVREEEIPDNIRWEKLAEFVQSAFRNGNLIKEATLKA